MAAVVRAAVASALIAAAPPHTDHAAFARLRADDLLLASIAQRLLVANAGRCAVQMPATGLVFAAIDQFAPTTRTIAAAEFGFATPIGIEAVVPGSPADRAGVKAGDGLLSIGVAEFAQAEPAAVASTRSRDSAERMIAALPTAAKLTLLVSRAGSPLALELVPQPACRSRIEVIPVAQLVSRTDGDTIQLSSGYIEAFGEAGTAVAFAHELAHQVLRHARKDKVNEREADRLSVHLLAAAGFDPAIAPRFWREHGAQLGARGHDSARKRITLLEAEIAALPR